MHCIIAAFLLLNVVPVKAVGDAELERIARDPWADSVDRNRARSQIEDRQNERLQEIRRSGSTNYEDKYWLRDQIDSRTTWDGRPFADVLKDVEQRIQQQAQRDREARDHREPAASAPGYDELDHFFYEGSRQVPRGAWTASLVGRFETIRGPSGRFLAVILEPCQDARGQSATCGRVTTRLGDTPEAALALAAARPARPAEWGDWDFKIQDGDVRVELRQKDGAWAGRLLTPSPDVPFGNTLHGYFGAQDPQAKLSAAQ